MLDMTSTSPSADRLVFEPFIPLMIVVQLRCYYQPIQTHTVYTAFVLHNMRHRSRVTCAMCSTILYAVVSYNDILNYSVEIPTRCSFVIEFIVTNFIEGSTCFERQTAHHQEL